MGTYYVRPPNPRRWWNRFFTTLQIGSGFLIVWWMPYTHVPHAGKAVGVVAVAAAAMSIHEGMNSAQKVFWSVILAAMLITELRAIDKDRENARSQDIQDRRELNSQFQTVLTEADEHFKTTSGGLTDSYALSKKGFDTTLIETRSVLGKTDEAAASAKEGIAELIGADSYLLVIPQHEFPVTPANQDSFLLYVVPVGKHIVWDGEISMGDGQLDQSFYAKQHENFRLQPITTANMSGFGKIVQPSRTGENWYAFTFTSRGTAGAENLDIRFNEGTGHWEFRYWLYTAKPSKGLPKLEVLKSLPWTVIQTPMLSP